MQTPLVLRLTATNSLRIIELVVSLGPSAGYVWAHFTFGRYNKAMEDYFLAKLIASVDRIDSRKRLQKAIYMLQFRQGFPLHLHYFLHYYGPFSRDLAQLMDQLKGSDIISEEENSGGLGFSSQITPRGKSVLAKFEESKTGRELKDRIDTFIDTFRNTINERSWELELASTIAYYYQASKDWGRAKDRTAHFKKVDPENATLRDALRLAKRAVGSDGAQTVS